MKRLALALLLTGCAPITASKRAVYTAVGADGWYQLSTLRLPEEARWSVDFPPYIYDCTPLRSWLASQDGLIVVLVPGLTGMSKHWRPVFSALHQLPLKALFEFRWDTHNELRQQQESLIRVVNQLLQCAPTEGAPVLVLSYGAGTVLAEQAAPWFVVPPGSDAIRVEVLQVDPANAERDVEPALASDFNFFYPREEKFDVAPAVGVEVTKVNATLGEMAAHLKKGDVITWAKSGR